MKGACVKLMALPRYPDGFFAITDERIVPRDPVELKRQTPRVITRVRVYGRLPARAGA